MTACPLRVSRSSASLPHAEGRSTLAVVDATLSGLPPAFEAASHDAMMKRQAAKAEKPLGPTEIGIDNFNFTPQVMTVKAGTKITWINNDDVPHLIVNVQNKFKQSTVLDTDQKYSVTIEKPGTYTYFCEAPGHRQAGMYGTLTVK